MASSCGIVILAAGNSSRMGEPKQLLPLGGVTLVRLATETALLSGMQPVIVVMGAYGDEMTRELSGLPITLASNAQWVTGMAGSIKTGLKAATELAPAIDALIFMVCDQPKVTTTLLLNLLGKQQETRKQIVASAYMGILGTPALFTREVFPALLQLSGDTGARKLIKTFADQVASVDFPEGIIDIDTKNDYASFIQP